MEKKKDNEQRPTFQPRMDVVILRDIEMTSRRLMNLVEELHALGRGAAEDWAQEAKENERLRAALDAMKPPKDSLERKG